MVMTRCSSVVVMLIMCLTINERFGSGTNHSAEEAEFQPLSVGITHKVPVRARKAGGGYKRHPTTNRPVVAISSVETESSSEISDETDSEEEGHCRSEEFWHIRGKRCVPLECPDGRKVDTGECFGSWTGGRMKSFGYGRYGRGTYQYFSKGHRHHSGIARFGIRAGGRKGR